MIAVDRSFSMAAPGADRRARDAGAAKRSTRRSGDRVAVVAFDDRADVVAAPGTAADARAAIAAIEPGFGATRYAAAFDKAAELLRTRTHRPPGHGQRSAAQRLRLRPAPCFRKVSSCASAMRGRGSANLSVSNAASLSAPRWHRHHPQLRRRRRAPTDVRIVADDDGRPSRASHDSGRRRDRCHSRRTFDGRRRNPAATSARDRRRDGYAADNDTLRRREARGLPRVLDPYRRPGDRRTASILTRARRRRRGRPRLRGPARSPARPSPRCRERSCASSVIALLSTHGLDRRAGDRLRGYLAAGGGMFVAAAADVDPRSSPRCSTGSRRWRPGMSAAPASLRRPICDIRSSGRSTLWPRTSARCVSIAPGRSTPRAGWRVVARYTNGGPALTSASQTSGAGDVLHVGCRTAVE